MRSAKDTNAPDLSDIFRAKQRIQGVAMRTPLVPAPALSALCGREVRLKLETTQPIGAFKIRGAANAIANLPSETAKRGVVCSSTGNHGRAVAYAARRLGIPATVCMSKLVPAVKVNAIRNLGADVRIYGDSQDEAQEEADRLVNDQGMTDVSPFDDFDVIAGQGTIGLEIMEDFPEVETVVAPLSGGGLLGGIAIAVKQTRPSVRIVGVTMEQGPAMHLSMAAGKPVAVEEVPSLADSLGGGIGDNNQLTLDVCRALVDDSLLVSEDEIAGAMAWIFFHEGWVTEGGGAVGTVPLLNGALQSSTGPVAVVLSGRNIDMKRFHGIVAEHADTFHPEV